MRETRFISQNKKNWEEFEVLLEGNKQDPEKLSDLFIQVTDDLSYARTHYPNRAIRVYLNNLARNVFRAVYSGKEKGNIFKSIGEFFKEDAPALVWKARYEMLVCLVIFILGFAAGALSSRHDPDFPTFILGPEYVSMTEKNIRSGDPMAVYKQQHEASMFMGISYNNIAVSFRTYVFGILFGVGSLALLIYNAIMVGTFQYFFVPRGVFVESFATIWLHGVPEIFAIIFSAGAGLRLARGIIFPDTYSRLQSFQNSAWESLRLMMCIVPVFIFAAFIEGFVTRYTELPQAVRIAFIFLNFILIIAYFVLYPYNKARGGNLKKLKNSAIFSSADFIYKEGTIYNGSDIIKGSINYFGANSKWIIRISLVFAIAVTAYIFFTTEPVTEFRIYNTFNYLFFQKLQLVSDYKTPVMYFINCIVFGLITLYSVQSFKKHFNIDQRRLSIVQIISCFISISLLNLVFFIEAENVGFFLWAILLPAVIIFNYQISKGIPAGKAFVQSISFPFAAFGKSGGTALTIYLLFLLFSLLLNSILFFFYEEIVNWSFDTAGMNQFDLLFSNFCNLFAVYVFSPFIISGFLILATSLEEISSARHLIEKIKTIKGK